MPPNIYQNLSQALTEANGKEVNVYIGGNPYDMSCIVVGKLMFGDLPDGICTVSSVAPQPRRALLFCIQDIEGMEEGGNRIDIILKNYERKV